MSTTSAILGNGPTAYIAGLMLPPIPPPPSSKEGEMTGVNTEESSAPKTRKISQKITPAIRDIIKRLAPKIKSNELAHETAAAQCKISITSLKNALRILEEGKDPAEKKVPQKITPEILKKIKKLAPKVKSQKLTYQKAAEQCGISKSAFRRAFQDFEKGENSTEKKAPQKITPEILKKIKELAPEVKSKNISQREGAEQCGISEAMFRRALLSLEKGEDPTVRKIQQKMTPKIAEKIKQLASKVLSGELKQQEVAEQCGVSVDAVKKQLKALENGEDSTVKKAPQTITVEIRDKIKSYVSRINKGNLTQADAAKLCGISQTAFSVAFNALKQGEDPSEKKDQRKMSVELEKKIKKLAQKVKRGEVTKRDAAAQCEISESKFLRVFQAYEKGEDPAVRKAPQKITPEILKKIKKLASDVQNGKLTIQDVADQCGVSESTARKQLQAFNADSTVKKERQKVTPEIRDKIKLFVPKIKKGILTQKGAAKAAAAQCGISESTAWKAFQALKNGEDPADRKVQLKMTQELAKKIKKLAPKVKKKIVTLKDAAEQCEISISRMVAALRILAQGGDPAERKAFQKVTPEMREKIKLLVPDIESGKLTLQAVADQCGISEATLRYVIKDLDEENNLSSSGKAPRVPMPPVRRDQDAASSSSGPSGRAAQDQGSLVHAASAPIHPAVAAAQHAPMTTAARAARPASWVNFSEIAALQLVQGISTSAIIPQTPITPTSPDATAQSAVGPASEEELLRLLEEDDEEWLKTVLV